MTVAVEADVLAYGLQGYSGILNVAFANGFQVAFGVGRYDVPGFLLEGDDNNARADWTATVMSLQVLRATYRFRGPMNSGPALGAVVLNQSWRLRSEPLGGETRFRPISAASSRGLRYWRSCPARSATRFSSAMTPHMCWTNSSAACS